MDRTGVTPMPAEMSRTGPVSFAEGEVAARRGHVKDRSRPQSLVQVAAGDAVGLLLDADPVGAVVGRRRQRVAADRGRLPGAADPQREVLARAGRRERGAVGGREVDRAHVLAFPHDLGHAQLPEGGPGRRRGSVPADEAVPPSFGRGQQVAERALPAWAEGRDLQGDPQLRAVAAGEVEQRVGVGHRQRARPGRWS